MKRIFLFLLLVFACATGAVGGNCDIFKSLVGWSKSTSKGHFSYRRVSSSRHHFKDINLCAKTPRADLHYTIDDLKTGQSVVVNCSENHCKSVDLSQNDLSSDSNGPNGDLTETGKVPNVSHMKRSSLTVRGGSVTFPKIPPVSLTSQKFLLQIVLTAFNIFCWAVPLRNTIFYESPRALSIANSFAGGVFLMLSFGHLIPHALTATSEHGYQAICYVLVGFLAMLLVERVAFCDDGIEEFHEGEIDFNKMMSISDHYDGRSSTSKGFSLSDRMKLVEDDDEEDDVLQMASPSPSQSIGRRKFQLNSAMILCIAMSIHSFFESAALALANSAASVYLMSACIALHQPAESLAIAVAFLKTTMRRWDMVIWLLAFSFSSCLGLMAGTLIKSIASDKIEGIVVALTAGTFVYVGTNEIVNEEFGIDRSRREKIINFVVYVLGMFTMAWMSSIAEQWEQH